MGGRQFAVLCLLCAGCRAQVGAPDDLAGLDAAEDLSPADAAPPDLIGADLSCGGPAVPEICGNGCDDDHNGFTDADDPACSTQFLMTTIGGSPSLSRMIIDPTPRLRMLDGNMVIANAMATLDGKLSSSVYFGLTATPYRVENLTLSPTGTGTISTFSTGYPVRDVCTFHGELIVVERNLPSVLHRFMADGMTEVGTVDIAGNLLATSCASDGNLLYVSTHDALANPSTFQAYDTNYAASGGAIALPAAIAADGNDRCLDFAFSEHTGFWGLFVNSGGGQNDNNMTAGKITPFAFDGGSGAPVDVTVPLDGGTLYGIGGFLP